MGVGDWDSKIQNITCKAREAVHIHPRIACYAKVDMDSHSIVVIKAMCCLELTSSLELWPYYPKMHDKPHYPGQRAV